MRVIESDKVIPLMRLLLLFNPNADKICKEMQEVVDIHTIDAVPVVRCGECERRSKSADLTDTVYCKWLSLQMPKDAFCSYGQRKDGEW